MQSGSPGSSCGHVPGRDERYAAGVQVGALESTTPGGPASSVPAQQAPRVAAADEDCALPASLFAAMDSLPVKSLTEETYSEDGDDAAAVRPAEPAYREEDVAVGRFMPCVASPTKAFPLADFDRPAEVAMADTACLDYGTEQLCKQIQAEAQATFHAARSGDAQALARMLAAGERANLAEGATGNTLLILAAGKGHAGVVGLLLEFRDVEVDRKNAEGNTALIVAALGNEALVMACLLNAGARINLANSVTGDTALIAAARNGHAEAVKLLLHRMDIRVDMVNAHGESALSLAVRNGHEDVVRSLLDAGAGVQCEQTYGKSGASLMALAASGGNTAIVQMLIDCATTGYANPDAW